MLAWIVSNAVCWFAAAREGYQYLDSATRNRWDSVHYLSIARDGYEMAFIEPAMADGPTVAGNIGWFPMYSGLIRLVHGLGFGYEVAGVVVAELATLIMMALLWCFVRGKAGAVKYLIMAVAAVFPAGIYFHAIFPMSTVVVAALGALLILTRGELGWWRVVAAGVCGAVAAASYPAGITIAPAMVACVIGRRGWNWRRWLPPAAVLTVLTALGPVAVGLLLEAHVGRWDAYLLVQDQFGTGVHNPAGVLSEIVGRGHIPFSTRSLLEGGPVLPESWPAIETVYSLVLVSLAAVAAVMARIRRTLTLVDVAILCFAVLAFTVSLIAGTIVSQYRPHTLLIPSLVLLRHLHPAILLTVLPVSLILAYQMARLFYVSYLV